MASMILLQVEASLMAVFAVIMLSSGVMYWIPT